MNSADLIPRYDAPWDASDFLARCLAANGLARREGFRFEEVSGLDDFARAIADRHDRTPLLCVSDTSDGYIDLVDTPHVRAVKTIFLFMPHAAGDMAARAECLRVMRSLFLQLVSALHLNKLSLTMDRVYIDPRISFSEIDRYFCASGACAFFQIAVDTYADISYDPAVWQIHPETILKTHAR